jgi:hypothetical protein
MLAQFFLYLHSWEVHSFDLLDCKVKLVEITTGKKSGHNHLKSNEQKILIAPSWHNNMDYNFGKLTFLDI